MAEQLYRAVLEVGAAVPITKVAELFGVSRQAVHRWIGWYRDEATRFAGTAMAHRTIFLVDRSNNVLEFKQYEDPRLQYWAA